MISSLVGHILEWTSVATIVAQYERGVLLRLGRFRRVVKPGLVWTVPFVDTVLKQNIVPATRNLEMQRLTTSDGVAVIIGVAIRWRVRHIKRVLLSVEDSDSVLDDSTYGEIAAFVRSSTWDELNSDEWVKLVEAAVRKRAERFGIGIDELWVTDLARARTISLVNS